MRRLPSAVRLILFFILVIIIEYYAYHSIMQSVEALSPTVKMLAKTIYLLASLLWFMVLFSFSSLRNSTNASTLMNLGLVFFMAFFIFKMVVASFVLLDDVRRFFFWLGSLYYGKAASPAWVVDGLSSSSVLRNLGLIIGGIVFGSFFYGITNRHRYKVTKVPMGFDHLPKAFNGFKVVQISDIHSGSFTSKEGVQHGVDLINELAPDIVLFTGDIVNNKSAEMLAYVDVFKQVKAKEGVYAIMGNHDYGDYYNWQTSEAKTENLQQLYDIHKTLGWNLLLDQHVIIERSGASISIIGVENISASFNSYGSLQKAYAGAENVPFKILMSHDPSHWDKEVVTDFQDIDLTLSGHTHGFQFGIELPWFKWSPAKFVYKQWAGLYNKGEQYLYVNRGFGFLGYPGRVGILPEITLIELSSN